MILVLEKVWVRGYKLVMPVYQMKRWERARTVGRATAGSGGLLRDKSQRPVSRSPNLSTKRGRVCGGRESVDTVGPGLAVNRCG